MQIGKKRRKTIQHFDGPGQAHELTFSCFGQRALLVDDAICKLLAQSITRATFRHGFELNAFVFMPEHVHLVVLPISPSGRISDLLFAIKRPFSYRVKQLLAAKDAHLLHQLTVQERPGKIAFRFWQEGPGYDRNLVKMETVRESIDYIHANPVKRGLCKSVDQWKWSSYRCYTERQDWNDEDLPVVEPFQFR